jgi:hypothetical protein
LGFPGRMCSARSEVVDDGHRQSNRCLNVNRDIDRIIREVASRVPSVSVTQMHKTHPDDDDGLWWFAVGDENDNIQIESSHGMCPFLVETDEQCSANARTAESIEQAVGMIVEFCESTDRTPVGGSRQRGGCIEGPGTQSDA